jgi:S-adenosylmethionine decarboxylase
MKHAFGADGRHVTDGGYRAFWDEVGAAFPDLGGAASTALYFENEKRLIGRHLPNLAGKRVLKSDLWDEARNTRILQWIQREGAQVFGIDLSRPVVRMARAEFKGAPLAAAEADVRTLPFAAERFDAVYSMGTIEHFAESEQAVQEFFRVLKPGGRAIIGVPNRHDPFLRPLLVALLYRLGLYDYGFEKSYSRKNLRRMLAGAGFEVVDDDAILFIPGWLRMLDLVGHTRCRPLVRVTAPLVQAFAWLDLHVKAVRRHGYLVVAIGERPRRLTSNRTFSAAGHEWLVDAHGCDPDALRSTATLKSLFVEIIDGLGLTTVGAPLWHSFDGESGVTGVQMLSESHLACHTYPEARYAAFSLYCCRPDPVRWPWESRLTTLLGAAGVTVRVVHRGPPASPPPDAPR